MPPNSKLTRHFGIITGRLLVAFPAKPQAPLIASRPGKGTASTLCSISGHLTPSLCLSVCLPLSILLFHPDNAPPA